MISVEPAITFDPPDPGQAGNVTEEVEVDVATLAANGRKHLFWATVQGGWIQRLEEQYLP